MPWVVEGNLKGPGGGGGATRSWSVASFTNTNAPSFSTTNETIPGSDRLTYIGTTAADLVNYSGAGTYGSQWKGKLGSWGVQFRAVHTRYAEFRVAPLGADASVRITVDGEEEQVKPHVFPTMQPLFVFHTIRIDLGPEPRAQDPLIRLDVSGSMTLSAVWVENGGEVVASPIRKRGFIMGDSLSESEVQNTGGELGSYVGYLPRILDGADIWNGGVRGTGPNTAANSLPNYIGRVSQIPTNIDFVVVSGWFNDRSAGRTPAVIGADFATLLAAIKTRAPAASIAVFGSPDPTGGTNASEWASIDTAVQASCQTAGVAYVSASTGRVWDPKGAILATAGPWITPEMVPWMLGSDQLHPTDAGHEVISRRVRDALVRLGWQFTTPAPLRAEVVTVLPAAGVPGVLYLRVD